MRSLHRPKYRQIIKRLIAARHAVHLSQADVTRQLGVVQSWLSNIETFERRLDVVEFLDLAAVYGQNPMWFLR